LIHFYKRLEGVVQGAVMTADLEEIIDKVSRFFLQTLPYSKSNGPFSQRQIEDMFAEARFCQALSCHLSPNYRPVLDILENKWMLCQAPKILFLTLCDNIRVNSNVIAVAQGIFDGGGDTVDLESWLCRRQRDNTREVFLAATRTLKPGPGWAVLKSYLLLLDLSQDPGRLEARLNKLVKERPGTLVQCLLVEDEQVACVQNTVAMVMAAQLDLDTVARCDVHLLSRVCQNRQEIWGGIVRAVQHDIGENCSLETAHKVADLLGALLSSPDCLTPLPRLESLDTALREIPHVVKQEILRRLTVNLSNLPRRNQT